MANEQGGVFISPNIKKERVTINPNGDIIDRNKNVIVPNVQEKVDIADIQATMARPVEPIYNAPQAPTTNAMSIQEQIDEAEKNLLKLKELKKLKIAEMKAQLELLEA